MITYHTYVNDLVVLDVAILEGTPPVLCVNLFCIFSKRDRKKEKYVRT